MFTLKADTFSKKTAPLFVLKMMNFVFEGVLYDACWRGIWGHRGAAPAREHAVGTHADRDDDRAARGIQLAIISTSITKGVR